jgi:hypothetical protein
VGRSQLKKNCLQLLPFCNVGSSFFFGKSQHFLSSPNVFLIVSAHYFQLAIIAAGKYFCFNPTAPSAAIPSSIAASTVLLLAVPLPLLLLQPGLNVRAAPDPDEAGGGERLVGPHDQMQRERGVGRRQREAGLRVRPARGESINSSIFNNAQNRWRN